MVSYYNSLTMFPAHHAASQPHSVAAASIAARHAASYFQGYHHPYGYPQHQFPSSATSPGNATVATSVATPTGHYPPNLSDLNSNVCPGSSGGTTISGPGFGPGLPSHHQHLDAGGGGFQPNPAITPPAWHTSQSAWHPGSPFWTGSCNVAGAGAPGQAMDGLLQQQNDLLSSAAAVSAGTRSPNTPPRGSSEGPALRGPSPGYPSGSHSSGSPNGTPTPVGNIYPGDFSDYYHIQHQQQQHHHHHLQQQQQQHQLRGSPHDHDDDDDDDDCRGDDTISPSPLSPHSSSRPQPARSPFEWMKKPSYQSQPDKSGEANIFLDAKDFIVKATTVALLII